MAHLSTRSDSLFARTRQARLFGLAVLASATVAACSLPPFPPGGPTGTKTSTSTKVGTDSGVRDAPSVTTDAPVDGGYADVLARQPDAPIDGAYADLVPRQPDAPIDGAYPDVLPRQPDAPVDRDFSDVPPWWTLDAPSDGGLPDGAGVQPDDRPADGSAYRQDSPARVDAMFTSVDSEPPDDATSDAVDGDLPSTLQWNAATEFSTTNNPFGAWRAGWTATLGSTFNLFTTLDATGIPLWYDPANFVLDTPNIQKNTSSFEWSGVQPGQISLRPGCSANEHAVLRWTAPAAATCTVDAQFFAGDYGETDGSILKNSATAVYRVASTSSNPRYTGTVSVSAGDTLDFVVGTAADGCAADDTPINVVVTCSSCNGTCVPTGCGPGFHDGGDGN